MLAVALKMAGDAVGCLLHSLQMVTKGCFLQSLVFEKKTNKTYNKIPINFQQFLLELMQIISRSLFFLRPMARGKYGFL